MSEQTNQPEVSQAAAIQCATRLRGYFGAQPWLSDAVNDPVFEIVQRAIDTARAEWRTHEVARLTKELGEEREKVGEIGRWFNEKKEQLAAAQSARANEDGSCLLRAALAELNALRSRAQLQQAEQALADTCRQLKDEVTVRLQAEQERDEAKELYSIACRDVRDLLTQRDLRQEQAKTQLSSLRAELAATQETVRRVERQRDALSASFNALKYPRFLDTATLLERAAQHIDDNTPAEWKSLLAPHLRNAALECRKALNQLPE